ncbi:MAG: hypothetical protein K9J13_00550 [Saprospiraceae bacterium]|nr:hypothetical protein [Saprospiraceae bacterium]
MKEKIIIWGSKNHARYTIDTIEKEDKYKIECLYDPTLNDDIEVYGYHVFGIQKSFSEIVRSKDIFGGIIAIGDNWVRKLMYDEIVKSIPDFKFVSIIHPNAQIGRNTIIGDGALIMAGVIVNTDAQVGKCCFLATKASLEHNCIMRDFSSISAGVITGGHTEIGELSALTLGVITFDHVKIGNQSVIGAASLVTRDIPDNVVAYGIPAKIVRKRKPDEKYLNPSE